MKILKIFGLVVGIHVVAFMFVFAIPGCRSTTRHSPSPHGNVSAVPTTTPAAVRPSHEASPLVAPAPAPDRALNPVASAAPAPMVSFDAGAAPVVRFNPSRPGSAAAAAAQTAAPDATAAVTYTVASGDTLWKIAKQNSISVKELAAANKLRADAPLRQGQKLMIPGKAAPISTGAAPSLATTGETMTYKVRAGDTLATIARRAGTTSAAIRSLNQLKGDLVRPGQSLQIPASPTAAALVSAPEDNAAPAVPRGGTGSVKHVIKAGETLGSIARRYGVSRRELSVANNIADPLKIRPGQELVIPNPKNVPSGAAAAPAPAATAPAPANAPEMATEAAPASDNPIAPAADTGSPIAPADAEAAPPVIQVQEGASPIAPSNP